MGPAVQSRDPPCGTLAAGRGEPRAAGQRGRHPGRLQPALPPLPSSGMAASDLQLQIHLCLNFFNWTLGCGSGSAFICVAVSRSGFSRRWEDFFLLLKIGEIALKF